MCNLFSPIEGVVSETWNPFLSLCAIVQASSWDSVNFNTLLIPASPRNEVLRRCREDCVFNTFTWEDGPAWVKVRTLNTVRTLLKQLSGNVMYCFIRVVIKRPMRLYYIHNNWGWVSISNICERMQGLISYKLIATLNKQEVQNRKCLFHRYKLITTL